jgi:hypothetical protein
MFSPPAEAKPVPGLVPAKQGLGEAGCCLVRNDVARDTRTDAEWSIEIGLEQKLFARDGDRWSRQKFQIEMDSKEIERAFSVVIVN